MLLVNLLFLLCTAFASKSSSTPAIAPLDAVESRVFKLADGLNVRQWISKNRDLLGLPAHMKLLLLRLANDFPLVSPTLADLEKSYTLYQLECINGTTIP